MRLTSLTRAAGRHAAPAYEPPAAVQVHPPAAAAPVPEPPELRAVTVSPALPAVPLPADLLAEARDVFAHDRRDLPVFRGVLGVRGWCGLHLPAGWPLS